MSDSDTNQGDINFSDWQKPTTTKPQPIRQTLRLSTSRVEKGTRKVNEFENKEKACKLLYALANSVKLEDAKIHKKFITRINKEIDEVVTDFGFDKGRLQTEGEKFGSTIITDMEQEQRVAEFEKKYEELGALIKNMKKSSNSNVAAEGGKALASGETPSTRGGPSRKREREFQEVSRCLDDLQNELKRVKGS